MIYEIKIKEGFKKILSRLSTQYAVVEKHEVVNMQKQG